MSVTQPTSGTMPAPAQAAGLAVTETATPGRRPVNRWYRPKNVVGKVVLIPPTT